MGDMADSLEAQIARLSFEAVLDLSGQSPTPFPVIEIRDIEDKGPLDQALASLSKYTW